ncbi:Telomerase Cajal body protein 1 [Haplosporangium sp. Z 27]|nr:Telomerase Cajal body protein 1 [Haplosporangium sp. Z 27]
MDIDEAHNNVASGEIESGEANITDSATQKESSSNGLLYQEEVVVSQEDWQSQTFQVFECQFSKETVDHGIVRSFTTRNTFNSTVGEARINMGVKDDHQKMTNGRENNFFKSLKWYEWKRVLMTNRNVARWTVLAIFNKRQQPSDIRVVSNGYSTFLRPDATTATPEDTQLTAGVLIKEGEVVYDMCWYPAMNSQDPATCCVLSSSRDHPVHLWDAFTGELRCSYTIVDHCEVNVAPNALCFNLDGSKIYCGSNNMIQIFDTTRPGRDSLKRPTVPTRKSRKGQKGVISCLAFNPDHSDLYAAGSYLKTIGLYDSRAEELLLLLRDKGSHNKKQQQSNTQSTSLSSPMGGVTQVQFSPDGMYLYSASRQDPMIRCWDIRNTAQVLHRLERPGELTNQRISFDISSDGRWLCTGDMNGSISIFDLADPESQVDPITRLSARIHGHEDVISAATFHPSSSILATCSGQRKYELSLDSDESDSSDSESINQDSNDTELKKVDSPSQSVILDSIYDINNSEKETIDNSIRLWSLPGDYVWYVNGQRWSNPAEMNTTDQQSTTNLNLEQSENQSSSSAAMAD